MARFVRFALTAALCAAASAKGFAQAATPRLGPGLRIVLLGTAGGPPPHADRLQPATLLQVAGKSFLIDAGENVAQQSLRAGVAPQRIDGLFLTHLHWDHVLGMGYLMATGWMGGRSLPMPIWGPPGSTEYVTREANALTIGEDIFRAQSPERPALQSLYPAHDVDLGTAGEIYRDGTVRVTAAATSHYGASGTARRRYGRDEAFAYRFDTPAGSVTFTGDTGPSAAVTDLARGSDVLVTEICDLDSIQRALVATLGSTKLDALMLHMREEHLSPEAVGLMATAAKVKKVVLTHFVMGPGANPADLVAKVRQYDGGEVVAGRDLMAVEVTRQ